MSGPAETAGQTVETGFGAVPADALGGAADAGAATPDPSTPQQSGVEGGGAPAPVAPAPVEIDGVSYTVEELRGHLSELQNVKQMRRSAQEDYEAAVAALNESRALENSAEFRQVKHLLEALAENPELADEWRDYRETGIGQGGGTMLKLATELKSLRERTDALVQEKEMVVVKDVLGEFIEWRNGLAGVGEPWTGVDDPRFKEHYARFAADVAPDSFYGTDLKAHFMATYGQALMDGVAASAKQSGIDETVSRVEAGRQAASTEVPTQTHEPVKFQPDMDRQDFGPEIDAAVAAGVLADW